MTKLLRYFKPYIWLLLALTVVITIQVWAQLQLPSRMATIVNEGIVGQDQSAIWRNGAIMLLITAVGGVAMVIAGFLAARVGTGFARDVRRELFNKVQSLGLAEIDQFSTASLITRSTNDVQTLQQTSVLTFRMVLMAPIMAVGAIIQAVSTAANMTWIIALAVVVLIAFVITLFVTAMPKFRIMQDKVDRLNLVTRENLTGLRVIRAFNNEKFEEERFGEASLDLKRIGLFVTRLMGLMQPIVMLIIYMAMVLVLWVGAHLVESGDVQIGDMMAFMQYAVQVVTSFMMLSILMILLPRANVSAGRVAEVLRVPLSIKPPREPKTPADNTGTLSFEHVSFSYADAEQPVLTDVSFTAKRGQVTAFIGSTGSGKSTLINLIPRFFDVSSGSVKLDGVDVRHYAPDDLTKKIGFIPQKAVLFSGTVKSNIKYGAPNASDADMKAAAKVAQAAGFIEKLDGQYDAPISQGGSNVSGGQKQRLSIARAIIKKPEVLVFDDSFSALDFKTDAKLREALKPIMKTTTTLIVAQRIGTIEHADQIIVLDQGSVVGIGTHRELIKTCKVYREIAQSQLSEKEIEESLKGGDRG